MLPTDTVYGIGADAFSADAVQRLLDAKARGRDMPPPVLIGESSLIRALAIDVPEEAKDLIARHWPGALTVICRIQPSLRMDLGDSKDTIALRVPDHELAREILRRTGPMAVSSANLSGLPAALTCDEAIDQLGDSVAVYLDGGELAAGGGLPSTIVDFTQSSDRGGAPGRCACRRGAAGDAAGPESTSASPPGNPRTAECASTSCPGVAVAVTYLVSGLCRRLAFRTGALARVRDRDVHTIEMPYFGGSRCWPGWPPLSCSPGPCPSSAARPTVREDSRAVLTAAAVICLVGVLDDVYELPPLAKFAGQVLAAGIAVALGVKMLWIPLPGEILSLNASASVAITVFFIVLCSNAVNFVDGLDGLATGVVGIGAGAFFAYSYLLTVLEGLTRATTASLVTVAIAGVCLGFLPHNFFPARMFMGDSGAMLLGLLLATSTISLTGQIDTSELEDGPCRPGPRRSCPWYCRWPSWPCRSWT